MIDLGTKRLIVVVTLSILDKKNCKNSTKILQKSCFREKYKNKNLDFV